MADVRNATDRDAAWNERYTNEKESALILQAKLNKASRDVEECRQKIDELTLQITALRAKESELTKSLKEEKQRAVVATARLNTTQSKSAKDIAGLEDKLRTAESIISKQQQQLAASTLANRQQTNYTSSSATSQPTSSVSESATAVALRTSLETLKPR
jgi:chromosome segregation ATPase